MSVARAGFDAAGVDDRQHAARPFDRRVEAIAGDAGGRVDDRDAAGEPVEQRGLAHVGTSDQGDDRGADDTA